MAVIGKIISGGQTGADRGALEAALKAGFAYGGLVPKGRLAEDGCVPAKFTAMEEADTEDYRFRTRWNAEHSDATLILAFSDQLEGGTQRTRQYCMNARKPVFVDNPNTPTTDGDQLAVFKWLAKVSKKIGGKPIVLNVAGPRESKEPGLELAVERYVSTLIAKDSARVNVPSAKSSVVSKCFLIVAALLIRWLANAATVQFGTAVLDDLNTMGSIRPTANSSGISTDFMIFLSAETLQSGMRLVIDQSNYMEYGVESVVMEAGTECGYNYFGTLIYDWAQTSPDSYTVSIGKMESIYLGYAAQDRSINPNEQYYGWMELYLSSENVLSIRNSAIDIKGNPIIVGAIPEPSSALLLILGCAGLALRRQKLLFQSHSSAEEDE